MWIALPDSFVSIVEDPANPGYLQVRSRTKRHLLNFFKDTPFEEDDLHIIEDKDGERDYQWRTIQPKSVVSHIMAQAVQKIDWSNFKDKAKKEDPELATMYGLWWSDHFSLQERRRNRPALVLNKKWKKAKK
jgi:hypothetical protein